MLQTFSHGVSCHSEFQLTCWHRQQVPIIIGPWLSDLIRPFCSQHSHFAPGVLALGALPQIQLRGSALPYVQNLLPARIYMAYSHTSIRSSETTLVCNPPPYGALLPTSSTYLLTLPTLIFQLSFYFYSLSLSHHIRK